MRHLISGIDCAIAGAAIAVTPAAPIPVTLRKSLRFIEIHPLWLCQLAFVSRLAASMEHPALNFHPELAVQRKKPGLLAETGLPS
jgi:hypothetical protein